MTKNKLLIDEKPGLNSFYIHVKYIPLFLGLSVNKKIKMINDNSLFLLGKINKVHGLSGEVSFTLNSDISFDEELPCLFVEIDGISVPFFIEEMRFSTDTTGFIKFEDVEKNEEARLLNGLPLFIEKKYLNEEFVAQNDFEFYDGFMLVDEKNGNIGIVKFIDTSTENHLFVVGDDDNEILIPVSEDYILKIDEDNRTIYLRLPEGLLEL